MSDFTDEVATGSAEEGRSLDLVQRTVVSLLLGVVMGSFAATLAGYLAVRGDQDLPHADVLGLWVMTGVMGLLTSCGILALNRRRWYHPLALVGLLPLLVSAFWIL